MIANESPAYWSRLAEHPLLFCRVNRELVSGKGCFQSSDLYRDGKLIVKWDLENDKPMKGMANQQILKYIDELRSESRL